MQRKTLLKILFLAAVLLSVAGAALKINYVAGADLIMIVGIVAHLLFIGIAIYEIARSNRIHTSDKVWWFVALVFIGGIAGLYYLLSGRRKVLAA